MGTKTIKPRSNNDGQIGSSDKYWNKGYFNLLHVNTLVTATGLEIADSVTLSNGGLIFQGSVSDTNETQLVVANPTGDRIITLPDASGTVALTSGIVTYSAGTGIDLAGTTFNLDLTEVIDTDSANRVLTSDGDGTLTAQENFTVTSVMQFTGNTVRLGDTQGTAVTVEKKTSSGASYHGGDLTIQAGNPQAGAGVDKNAGDLILKSGHSTGTGDPGKVEIWANRAYGSSSGTAINAEKVAEFSNPGGTPTFKVLDNATDYVQIEAAANTTISTANSGGNSNLILDAQGNIELNADGNSITFWDNTTKIMDVTSSELKLISIQGIQFEGTPDSYETNFTFTDPTADRTITLPDASGTVALTSDLPGNFANTDLTLTAPRTHTCDDNVLIFRTDSNADSAILTLDGASGEVTFGYNHANALIGVYRFYFGASNPDFRIYENQTHGSNYGKFTYAGALGGDRTYTLPDATGTVALTSDIGVTTLSGTTANGLTTYASAGTLDVEPNLKWDGNDFEITSATNAKPEVIIQTTGNHTSGGTLQFKLDKGAAGADGDIPGGVLFTTDNSNAALKNIGMIYSELTTATAGSERGTMYLKVAEYDGTISTGLRLQGMDSNGEIDVTIGAGSASTATVTGKLDVDGSRLSLKSQGELYFYDGDNSHSTRIIHSTGSSNRSIQLPDADGTIQLQGGAGEILHVNISQGSSTMVYMNTQNYWYSMSGYSVTTGYTGVITSHSNFSFSSQGSHPGYTAIRACKVTKIIATWRMSSSFFGTTDDFALEFGVLKWTNGDDSTSSVAVTDMTVTDHNGNYRENKIYKKTFVITDNADAALAAGDSFNLFARCTSAAATNGGSTVRIFWYGEVTAEVVLT